MKKLGLLEESRHNTLRSFRNYVIGSPNQYIKPSALIHLYDYELFFVILKSLDQELTLYHLDEFRKQRIREEAEEPRPEPKDGTMVVS